MLDDLRRQSDIISQEAMIGGDSLTLSIQRLSGFVDDAKGLFQKYLSEPFTNFFSRGDMVKVGSKLQQDGNYADLRPLLLQVPPGLKVDLLTYATVLNSSAEGIRQLRDHVLKPFEHWLQQKLGNPHSLASLTNSLNISGYHPQNTDELQKALLNCFVPANTIQQSKMTYGQAIQRNADWMPLTKEYERLENNFDEKTHKEIIKLTNSITDLLDTLLSRIQEDPITYKPSATTIKALADMTYSIGRELEFYGLLRHKTREFIVSMEANVQKLKTVKIAA